MPLALFLFCQKSFLQNQSGFQKPKTVVSHITGTWRIAFVGSRIRVAHQFPLVLLTSKLRWSHICSAPQPTTTSRSSNHDIGRVRFELSGVCLDAFFLQSPLTRHRSSAQRLLRNELDRAEPMFEEKNMFLFVCYCFP